MNTTQTSKRPNIIFFQCDSMDGRAMSWIGHPAAYTPNMDAMAAAGCAFENTYCPSPLCVPSRAALWTGQDVHKIGAWNNHRGLTDERDLEDDLVDAGYRMKTIGRDDRYSDNHSEPCLITGATRSAWINLPRSYGNAIASVTDESTKRFRMRDWIHIDNAIDYLRKESQQGDEAPFFLHLGVVHPHPGAGYNATQYWFDKINRNKIPQPQSPQEEHPCMEYMRILKHCEEKLTDEERLFIRHCYLAMIAEVDHMLGSLRRTLEETGLAKDTIIIFTSDHGDLSMDQDQNRKCALFEGSVRIPLLITGPGIQEGRRIKALTNLLDVHATICEYAGIPLQEEHDGISLLPWFTGEQGHRRDVIFSQYHASYMPTASFMLRTKDWKYIYYLNQEPQLFELNDDPHEVNNVSTMNPKLCAQFEKQLRDFLAPVTPEEIHEAALKINHRDFERWLDGRSAGEILPFFKEKFIGWEEQHTEKLLAWHEAGKLALMTT